MRERPHAASPAPRPGGRPEPTATAQARSGVFRAVPSRRPPSPRPSANRKRRRSQGPSGQLVCVDCPFGAGLNLSRAGPTGAEWTLWTLWTLDPLARGADGIVHYVHSVHSPRPTRARGRPDEAQELGPSHPSSPSAAPCRGTGSTASLPSLRLGSGRGASGYGRDLASMPCAFRLRQSSMARTIR